MPRHYLIPTLDIFVELNGNGYRFVFINDIYVQIPCIYRADYSVNVLGWFGGNTRPSEELMECCWENDR